jgi:hypothetical protein
VEVGEGRRGRFKPLPHATRLRPWPRPAPSCVAAAGPKPPRPPPPPLPHRASAISVRASSAAVGRAAVRWCSWNAAISGLGSAE